MESDGDSSFPVITNVRRKETSQRILDLTLEMIYVLTGHDYILTKKPCDRTARSRHPYASKESSGTLNPGTESPAREENGEKRILGLANKIIQLLTGQVPLWCEDVAVCFSAEEWDYVEEHKELYRDLVKDTRRPRDSLGDAERRPREWCPIPVFSSDCTNLGQSDLKKLLTVNNPQKRPISPVGDNAGNPTDVPQPPKDVPGELGPPRAQKQSAPRTAEVYTPAIERPPGHHEPKPVLEERVTLPGVSSPEGRSRAEDISLRITEVKSLSQERDVRTFDNETVGGKAMTTLEKMEARSGPDSELRNPGRARRSAQHQRIYTVEKPFSCSECAERFADKQSLFRHQLAHADTPEGDRTFLYESTVLGRHEVHLQAKTLISSECGTPAEVFSCSECEQIFFDRQRLFRHQFLHLHSPQKAYPCPECERTFASEAGLTTHQRSHKKTPIACGECGKSFKQTASLLHHQWTHTGVKAFACQCGKRYTSQSALCSHQRVHTGEKPYVCCECGKRFHKKSILNSHMMVHTGLKPYLCAECGVSYCHKKDLAKHQLTHQKDIGRL